MIWFANRIEILFILFLRLSLIRSIFRSNDTQPKRFFVKFFKYYNDWDKHNVNIGHHRAIHVYLWDIYFDNVGNYWQCSINFNLFISAISSTIFPLLSSFSCFIRSLFSHYQSHRRHISKSQCIVSFTHQYSWSQSEFRLHFCSICTQRYTIVIIMDYRFIYHWTTLSRFLSIKTSDHLPKENCSFCCSNAVYFNSVEQHQCSLSLWHY